METKHLISTVAVRASFLRAHFATRKPRRKSRSMDSQSRMTHYLGIVTNASSVHFAVNGFLRRSASQPVNQDIIPIFAFGVSTRAVDRAEFNTLAKGPCDEITLAFAAHNLAEFGTAAKLLARKSVRSCKCFGHPTVSASSSGTGQQRVLQTSKSTKHDKYTA